MNEMRDEGRISVIYCAVYPYHAVEHISHKPKYSCIFTAVAWTHQDETFSFQLLLHFFNVFVYWSEYLLFEVVLAESFHGLLEKVVW